LRSFFSSRGPLLLLLSLLLACSLWQTGKEGKEEPGQEPGEEFDPFAFPGDAEVVTNSADIDSSSTEDSSLYFIQPEVKPSYPPEVYRVQLYASQYYNEAFEEKEIAAAVFNEPILISYAAPYYRVEIGNFPTDAEANSFLRLAKSRGYSQSWVISEPVDSLFWINLAADTVSVDSSAIKDGRQ
jgi:hypothetical protein